MFVNTHAMRSTVSGSEHHHLTGKISLLSAEHQGIFPRDESAPPIDIMRGNKFLVKFLPLCSLQSSLRKIWWRRCSCTRCNLGIAGVLHGRMVGMSGHSKWSTIKHKKAVVDSKRSGVFTKMANGITVAVKKGGGVGDPDMNFALRLAVDRARAVNMPKDNIERAIEKGMGKGGDGQSMDELVLEGYGPGGTAIVVEAVTDNRNRTVSEVKNILEKKGGRLGEPGSVLYQFDRVGSIEIAGDLDEDLELSLIDLGLIATEKEEETTFLITQVEAVQAITEALRRAGKSSVHSSLGYKPKLTVDPGESRVPLENLIESLADHDDVQEVYVNAI